MLKIIWTLPESEPPSELRKYVLHGDFFLRTEAGDFPCVSWKEQPVLALSSFMVAVFQLTNKQHRFQVPISFDLYSVVLDRPDNNSLITLHFRRSYRPVSLERLPPLTLPLVELCHILIQAGRNMLAECDAKGIGLPHELEGLAHNIEQLHKIVGTIQK